MQYQPKLLIVFFNHLSTLFHIYLLLNEMAAQSDSPSINSSSVHPGSSKASILDISLPSKSFQFLPVDIVPQHVPSLLWKISKDVRTTWLLLT